MFFYFIQLNNLKKKLDNLSLTHAPNTPHLIYKNSRLYLLPSLYWFTKINNNFPKLDHLKQLIDSHPFETNFVNNLQNWYLAILLWQNLIFSLLEANNQSIGNFIVFFLICNKNIILILHHSTFAFFYLNLTPWWWPEVEAGQPIGHICLLAGWPNKALTNCLSLQCRHVAPSMCCCIIRVKYTKFTWIPPNHSIFVCTIARMSSNQSTNKSKHFEAEERNWMRKYPWSNNNYRNRIKT